MKKLLSLVLALALCLCAVSALADIKIGQVEYAAHGNQSFAVLTVAVDGDTIVAAYIDEFQFMDATLATGVPNSDGAFGGNVAEGLVLGSKRVNNEYYSNNMKERANASTPIADSFDAIEAFVTGKTISELEAEVEGKSNVEMVDAVSGATLVDTIGYIKGLIEAAKAAQ